MYLKCARVKRVSDAGSLGLVDLERRLWLESSVSFIYLGTEKNHKMKSVRPRQQTIIVT